jgi:intein/homing endonuclease
VSTQPSAQVAITWLENLYHTYIQYGLKDKADKVSIEIRKLGNKATSELKTIEISVTIPTEEVKKFINALIDGDLNTALKRIAVYYIPKRGEVIKQLNDVYKESPIQFLFTRKNKIVQEE